MRPKQANRKEGTTIERKATDALSMAVQLQTEKRGKLYGSNPKYPEVAAEVKAEALQSSIAHQRSILEAAYQRGRIDLNDTETVKAQAMEFMRACEDACVFPTMLSFSACLGVSRQRVYRYIAENPRSDTTAFLDQLRSSWAAIIAQAALSKMADGPTSIFLLKNSGQNLTDRQELELSQKPADPLGDIDEEAIKAEMIAKYSDLPED